MARLGQSRLGFATGLLCGIAAVFGLRYVVNHTTAADWLVAPLLLPDTGGRADAIVVPGAGVIGECVPNLNGVRRVLRSARLWRDKRAPLMVFTGGTGGSCPVAVAMARLAREIGVPETSIHVETASRNTRENAELSVTLLRSLRVRRVLVVTDRLHMRRAAAAFEHAGFDVERASVPIYEGHADNVSMLRAGAREAVALSYYRARGWIGPRDASQDTPGANRPPITHDSLASESSHRDIMQAHVANPTGPLVVLGASYAQGWVPDTLAGMPVLNKGVTGQQSGELLQRFAQDVVTARPRAVIVWGFANDIFRSANDSEGALNRVRDNYTSMIELARRNGIELIVATEVTIRPPKTWSETLASWIGGVLGRKAYQDRVNEYILAGNRDLMNLAQQHNLLVLDLQPVLSDGSGRRRREYAHVDGSHISPEGYAALTAYAAPILERHFSDTSREQ